MCNENISLGFMNLANILPMPIAQRSLLPNMMNVKTHEYYTSRCGVNCSYPAKLCDYMIYIQSNTNDILYLRLNTLIYQRELKKEGPPKSFQFHVTQTILTPRTEDIIHGIFWRPHNLEQVQLICWFWDES